MQAYETVDENEFFLHIEKKYLQMSLHSCTCKSKDSRITNITTKAKKYTKEAKFLQTDAFPEKQTSAVCHQSPLSLPFRLPL